MPGAWWGQEVSMKWWSIPPLNYYLKTQYFVVLDFVSSSGSPTRTWNGTQVLLYFTIILKSIMPGGCCVWTDTKPQCWIGSTHISRLWVHYDMSHRARFGNLFLESKIRYRMPHHNNLSLVWLYLEGLMVQIHLRWRSFDG